MFTNLSYQDKQAFFALLDEYFESRPQHRPGGGEASSSAAAPPVSFSSKPSSRAAPPAAPVRSVPAARSTPPAAPVRANSHTASNDSSPPGTRPGSTTGARQLGQAKGAFDSGMSKVVGNSTVKSGLNKFGAGSIAHKYSGGSTFKPTGNVPGPGERHLPPPPPGWKSGGGGGGSVGTGGYAEEKVAPAPAYSGAGRAQAAYDFDGGDANDLPVQAGEVVTIVAKTSADWWTCQNASGKQGLVPANYMTEL